MIKYEGELGPGMMVHRCNPSYLRGRCRRITIQDWLGQKLKMLSEKQTKVKRAGSTAEAVEGLP
jgi:hypothetical protein